MAEVIDLYKAQRLGCPLTGDFGPARGQKPPVSYRPGRADQASCAAIDGNGWKAAISDAQPAEVILLGGWISAAARPRQRAADAALLTPNGFA
jgi:hypothetical protein